MSFSNHGLFGLFIYSRQLYVSFDSLSVCSVPLELEDKKILMFFKKTFSLLLLPGD